MTTADTIPLSAHTVKHEAHRWVRLSKHKFAHCLLARMRDGLGELGQWDAKEITYIDWDLEEGDE